MCYNTSKSGSSKKNGNIIKRQTNLDTNGMCHLSLKAKQIKFEVTPCNNSLWWQGVVLRRACCLPNVPNSILSGLKAPSLKGQGHFHSAKGTSIGQSYSRWETFEGAPRPNSRGHRDHGLCGLCVASVLYPDNLLGTISKLLLSSTWWAIKHIYLFTSNLHRNVTFNCCRKRLGVGMECHILWIWGPSFEEGGQYLLDEGLDAFGDFFSVRLQETKPMLS